MVKVTAEIIQRMEQLFPGIEEQIQWFEALDLPPCPLCGSTDIASSQAGVLGRTVHLQAATTKFRLTMGGISQGIYFCNTCNKQFGPTERMRVEKNTCEAQLPISFLFS